MPNPDMLAFTYQIKRIIRDMKHTAMAGEDEALKRDLAVDALYAVCERIDHDFA